MDRGNPESLTLKWSQEYIPGAGLRGRPAREEGVSTMIKTMLAGVLAVLALDPPLHPQVNFRQAFVGTSYWFDLEVPRSTWFAFSRGAQDELSPEIQGAVSRYVDQGLQNVGKCHDGWILKDVTVDVEGAHHFRGVCIMPSVMI